MLRAFLAEHDEPCPVCGYNLRGLTGEACPECQQRLVLRVGLAAPDLVSFVLAVVGLSACGVLAAFLLGTVLVVVVLERDWPSRSDSLFFIVWPAVALVVDGALVWLLLRRRGRAWFRSRPSDKRALLAAGCWASSVAVFVSWIWGMFAM
jgi:hypothetical protein